MKKYNQFINESIGDIFNRKYTYSDRVKDDLIGILMEVQRISEKDFKKIDNIVELVKNYISENDIKNIILDCEQNNKRSRLCAELIYNDIIKNKQ